MGIFNFIERRKQKRKLRETQTLLRAFASLDTLEKAGMLAFDVKTRRLFIEQPLALLMIKDAESWVNFINNVFQWLYLRQCTEAWEKYIQREELAAVRQAAKKLPSMSLADIERVRRARRNEVSVSDIEPPKIEPFEFFVIAENSETEGTEKPGGKVSWVGYFDPETKDMDVASWEDVSRFIQKE